MKLQLLVSIAFCIGGYVDGFVVRPGMTGSGEFRLDGPCLPGRKRLFRLLDDGTTAAGSDVFDDEIFAACIPEPVRDLNLRSFLHGAEILFGGVDPLDAGEVRRVL